MSLSKQRNYYLFTSLVVEKCGQVLRKSLEEYWKSISLASLQDFLDSNFHVFLDLYRPSSVCACTHAGTRTGPRVLYQKQWNNLFISDFSSSCRYKANPLLLLDDLDVTLCACLLLNTKSTTSTETAAIVSILEARNYVAHSKEASINDTDFKQKWTDVSKSLLYLASLISPTFEANTKREIKELLDRTIDDAECKRLVETVKALFRDDTFSEKLKDVDCKIDEIKSNALNLVSTSTEVRQAMGRLNTKTSQAVEKVEHIDKTTTNAHSLLLQTSEAARRISETTEVTKKSFVMNRSDTVEIKDKVNHVQRLSAICRTKTEALLEKTNATHSIVSKTRERTEDLKKTTEALQSLAANTRQRVEEIHNTTLETQNLCVNEFEALREQLGSNLSIIKRKEIQDGSEILVKKQKFEKELTKDVISLQQLLVKIYQDYTDSVPLSPICPDECLPIDKIFGSLEMKEDLLKGRRDSNRPLFRNNTNEVDLQHECFKELNSYKDLFTGDETLRVKRIFLTAGAGRGKSTYCVRMLADWCNGMIRSKTSESQDLSDNENEMLNYPLLFFIPLRHVDSSNSVVDMIQNVLLPDYQEYHDSVLSVLKHMPQKCLIILDGLDEWCPLNGNDSSLPFDGLPDKRGTEGCTQIITTRPWKLESIRYRFSNFDKVVSIEGLDGFGLMSIFKNILECWYKIPSTSHDYEQKVSAFQCILTSSIYESFYESLFKIPLIATFFITLWMEKNYFSFWMEKGQLPDTMTTLYISLLQLLVVKSYGGVGFKGRLTEEEKYSIDEEGWLSSVEELPDVLRKNGDLLSKYSTLLLSLSKVAFESLLSNDKVLVFRKDILNDAIGERELNVALKLGFLCQSKVPGTIHSRLVSVNFFHKTLQEFFTALWIAHKKEDIYQKFCSHCSSVQTILDLSNVILFIIGLDQDLAYDFSNHIATVCENDAIVKNYRSSLFDDSNMEILYKMQFKFFEECKNRNEFKIADIVLFNESIFLIDTEEMKMINSLVTMNIPHIRSVTLDFKRRFSLFNFDIGPKTKPPDITVFLDLIGKGTRLKKIMIKGCIRETLEALIQNPCLKDTLSVLKITNTDMSIYDFYPCLESGLLLRALRPLQNLTALSLENLTLQQSDIFDLNEFCKSTSNLESFRFRCHKVVADVGLDFDLRNNEKLKDIDLTQVLVENLQLNPIHLEDLNFTNIYGSLENIINDLSKCRNLRNVDIDNFPGQCGMLFNALPECKQLHTLYICQPDMTMDYNMQLKKETIKEDSQSLASVIPRLTTVEHIRLKNITFDDLPLTLSDAMSSKLCVELWNIFMTPENWKHFVTSLLTTKPDVRVYMRDTNIDDESMSLLKTKNGIKASPGDPDPWELFLRI